MDLSFGSLETVFTLALFILTIYLYKTWKYDYWKKRGIPHLSHTPIFGTIKQLKSLDRSFTLGQKEIYEKFGKERYAGMYLLGKPSLFVMDPELIKHVLVKDFDYFVDRGFVINEEADPLNAKHLVSLRGDKWRFVRNKLSPTFTSGKMKRMFPLMHICSKELVKYLEELPEDKTVVEIKDLMANFTTDVISSCAFGIQTNSLKDPNSEFRTIGRDLMEPKFVRTLTALIGQMVPITQRLFKFGVIPQYAVDFFRNAVKSTMNYREQNKITRNDFMQLLIQLKNTGKVDDDDDDDDEAEDKNENIAVPGKASTFDLDHDDLTAQFLVFFFAGFETSSSVISFALYELALQIEIQRRLRNEVDQVLRKHDGKLSYEAIQEMEFLDMVIQESLRKYPPATIVMRACRKDYKIPESKHVIEKGTQVFVPIYSLHQDSRYYPNPEKFDPERFTEENRRKRHNYVFLPFGAGPRICIGMRFGLMQAKVGLASLISKFEFNVSKDTKIPPSFDPKANTLMAKGGIWLQISKRK